MKYNTYNTDWLLEKVQKAEKIEYLFFWGHAASKDGSVTKSCFSQWWPAVFTVDGVDYPTAEHWMMGQKAQLFNDQEMFDKILKTKTPFEAKKLGRKVCNFDPKVWGENCFRIVCEGNLYKFSQHPDLKRFLINTADKVLVEASPVDNIWGIGMAQDNINIENPYLWKGSNLLGFALMEVRDQLKQEKT
ncbi:NADAR family protein [Bacteroides sp. 519]|uniref:NADAR family protein n=1 Tax=Bacteroides sp. 519 TaxID=2302937 RepID=UPI0013D50052|nr:NADAR family protein [Bacteroides sp. 519]NDV60387.1 NADAR family protein [Bacteroides sp. 519]